MARKKKKKAPETPVVPPSTVSSRFRFFLWMCSFFALAALFMRVDVMTVWPGAEAYSLELSLSNERGRFLPAYLHGLLVDGGATLFEDADLFFLFPRLLSAVVMLCFAVLYYRWGKLLFGKETVQLQLLLVAASLWIPFYGKVATADSLLLFSHLGLWLSLIFVIRSGLLRYQLYLGAFTLLGSIIAPFSTALLAFAFAGSFYSKSDIPTILKRAWPGLVIPLIGFLVSPESDWTYFGAGSRQWLYALVGTLPFIGFVFAGGRDLIFKAKKREDLALIYIGILLASLVSHSPLFGVILCLIAGKQLQLYFGKGYPWNNWVRGPAILHLIFALITCFLLLLGGFITFRGDGYRAFLGMIAAYWIFSLFGVLGIYGMRRDFTVGGVVLSGLLATLFFWVQVYPYFETERNWPTEFVQQLKNERLQSNNTKDILTNEVARSDSSVSDPLSFSPDAAYNTSNLRPYLQRAGIAYNSSTEDAELIITSFPADTTDRELLIDLEGRSWLQLYRFGLKQSIKNNNTQ